MLTIKHIVPTLIISAFLISGVQLPVKAAPGGTANAVVVAQGQTTLSTLVTLVTAAGLAPTLSATTSPAPFTIFAPNNAAFAALGANTVNTLSDSSNVTLLADILKYHVVPGAELSAAQAIAASPTTRNSVQGDAIAISSPSAGNVTLNAATQNATVITPDVAATNAYVHVIDKVILSPALTTRLNTAVADYTNITKIATRTTDVSTLVSLLSATNLVAPLSAVGPFTVFAPTNAAFAALGTNTLNVLALPANATLLSDILKYHVVSGNVSAAQAQALTTANSLQGDAIALSSTGAGNVTLNASTQGAKVTTLDVLGSNGRIHIIDKVILSSALTTRLNAAIAAAASTPATTTPATAPKTLTKTGDNLALLPFIGIAILALGAFGFYNLKKKN
jgi:transforming growth factor-beta-induced protein